MDPGKSRNSTLAYVLHESTSIVHIRTAGQHALRLTRSRAVTRSSSEYSTAGAAERPARLAKGHAHPVQRWHTRPVATGAARQELPEHMLLFEGRARIEENEHLHNRRAHTVIELFSKGHKGTTGDTSYDWMLSLPMPERACPRPPRPCPRPFLLSASEFDKGDALMR